MKTIQKLSEKSLSLRYKIVQLDLQINRLQCRIQEMDDDERFCRADLDFLKIYIRQLEQLIVTSPDSDGKELLPLQRQITQARTKWNRNKEKLKELQRRKQNNTEVKLLTQRFLRDQLQIQLEQINTLIQQLEKKKGTL